MMKVLINHCWCFDSNWGGNYDCEAIVTIFRIKDGNTYHDAPTVDWVSLFDVVDYQKETFYTSKVCRLKPEVVQWLKDNVKDTKCVGHKQGWCVGTDKYNAKNPLDFSVFFYRRTDAMRFVRRWSSFKNPVHYLNYFKDIRKELNPITNKLVRVPR